jgi:hypothetical protein
VRTRRLARRARRLGPQAIRPLAGVLPAAPPPSRPIFLIGCPRSGTSMLFKVLKQSPELAFLKDEGHALWEAFHHPRRHGWDSNALGAADIAPREREFLYLMLRLRGRDRRFLDKTPKNCLRIAYLDALFPDARFVLLRRRAADNVNSLIEGWRAYPRYLTYRLPEPLTGPGIPNATAWSFVLVPGWRSLRSAPLEEICAQQYVASNEAMVAAREQLPPDRVVDVAYEDVVARPREELGRIFERLGLTFGDEARRLAEALDRTPVNSVTPPRREKWRDENPAEIERILPLVAETERRLGYDR